jgi:uncharacterized membrane protein YbaN (DUF454 family)
MRNTSPPPQVAAPTVADAADAAPGRDPGVVHASFGRLRVHLPHWSGRRGDEVAGAVRRLAGVSYAEANRFTGNVLILFEPRQTTAQALLEALPALRLDVPVPAARVGVPNVVPGPDAGGTGAGRVVYKLLGWASVGMAVVGAALPGIPTTPFVLLAGYFFIRSSPEAHEWLRQSRWFGPSLRDWEEHRALRRSVRNAAAALIIAGMGFTVLLGLPPGLQTTILLLQLVGLAIVLSLPVVDPPPPAVAGAAV